MKKIFLSLMCITILSGCVSSYPPLHGSKELPLETGQISRYGRACSYSLLGFIGPFGSNSLVDAAANARLSKVHYYDQSYEYYVLFSKHCRNAYGY